MRNPDIPACVNSENTQLCELKHSVDTMAKALHELDERYQARLLARKEQQQEETESPVEPAQLGGVDATGDFSQDEDEVMAGSS